jgi:predicted kinase
VQARADAELAAGRSVVVDATLLQRRRRDALRSIAGRRQAAAVLVLATAERATIEARAAARSADPSEVSDADLAVHDALARSAEPPDEWPAEARVDASAERPLDAHLAALAERVLSAAAARVGVAPERA